MWNELRVPKWKTEHTAAEWKTKSGSLFFTHAIRFLPHFRCASIFFFLNGASAHPLSSSWSKIHSIAHTCKMAISMAGEHAHIWLDRFFNINDNTCNINIFRIIIAYKHTIRDGRKYGKQAGGSECTEERERAKLNSNEQQTTKENCSTYEIENKQSLNDFMTIHMFKMAIFWNRNKNATYTANSPMSKGEYVICSNFYRRCYFFYNRLLCVFCFRFVWKTHASRVFIRFWKSTLKDVSASFQASYKMSKLAHTSNVSMFFFLL